MSEADTATLIEMTAEVVAAYVERNHVGAADLPTLIASTHAALAGLGKAPEAEPVAAKPTPAVSIRKSVTDDYILSLDDGKPYKTLKRHLAGLGMTPEEYRAKWGLPHDYPMVSAAYSAKRSELAKSLGLGNIRKKG